MYTRPVTTETLPHETCLIARFMRPTWGPPGPDRTPMLAPWTLLSGLLYCLYLCSITRRSLLRTHFSTNCSLTSRDIMCVRLSTISVIKSALEIWWMQCPDGVRGAKTTNHIIPLHGSEGLLNSLTTDSFSLLNKFCFHENINFVWYWSSNSN